MIMDIHEYSAAFNVCIQIIFLYVCIFKMHLIDTQKHIIYSFQIKKRSQDIKNNRT